MLKPMSSHMSDGNQKPQFVDTHCHIHFHDYGLDPDEVIETARIYGVTKLLCVGCTLEDSRAGTDFVANRDGCWASVGIHPHEAKQYPNTDQLSSQLKELVQKPKVVAVGEVGLDYYYSHSSRQQQIRLLEAQLQLAQEYSLPVVFHVRNAFDDFWAVYDNFHGIRGVIHSFTADKSELLRVLKRDLFIGLNGIMTFTKDPGQLDMARAVPMSKLLLETDAPYLTPKPHRGTICQPRHVEVTATFLAELRGERLSMVAEATSSQATKLFNLV
jgi:TatD DNase family protein